MVAEAEALRAMRQVLGDESAVWRSEEQRQAMRVVLEGKRDAVVILRTGGGKSMLAIIPSLLEKNEATVLVLPLNSLLMDFQRRLTSMGVPFQTYDRNVNEGALNSKDNLILVTADKARSQGWREALAILNEKKPIKRTVFDECHVPLIANDYREALEDVYEIRSIAMQIICLSGTLPPSCISDLISAFGLVEDTQVIRQCTNRGELIYILEKLPSSELMHRAIRIMEEEMQTWQNRDRGLVFVPTLSLGRLVANKKGWPFYHGNQETMTDEERRETYRAWVRGDSKIMLATSAFSTGNDYPHVRVVIHLNKPFEMLEFVQGQGRAGRDGSPAKAYTLVPPSASPPKLEAQDKDHKGKQAMHDHLYTYGLKRCLRYGTTHHIDGTGISCRQLVCNQKCCVCKEDMYHNPASIVMAPMPKPRPFAQSVPSKRPASPTFTFRPPPEHRDAHPFATKPSENPFLEAANNATMKRMTKQLATAELAHGMRKALESFQDTCSFCTAMGSKGTKPHMIHNCPSFGPQSEAEFEEYWAWRQTLEYLKHHKKICFKCHVPQINDNLHPTFGKNDCEFKDIVAPAAFGIFCNVRARTAAEAHFKQKWSSRERFSGWLMGKPASGSQSNLMDLFLWFVDQQA
jgi:superfamily II DNA or RNA helicase